MNNKKEMRLFLYHYKDGDGNSYSDVLIAEDEEDAIKVVEEILEAEDEYEKRNDMLHIWRDKKSIEVISIERFGGYRVRVEEITKKGE